MKISYQQAFDAMSALKDIMTAKGLCGSTQIKLVRLWRELEGHTKTMTEAESMLASEYGVVGENGVIEFYDNEKRGEFLRRRKEMFSEEVDLNCVSIRAEEAFWSASSPSALVLLDQIILIEEEEK